jgi:flagellar basal-body rod protein FlgC
MTIGAISSGASAVSAGLWWSALSASNVARAGVASAPEDEAPAVARVQFAERPGGGVTVRATSERGDGVEVRDTVKVHEPDNPLADARGYVQRPGIQTPGELAEMLIASAFVAANLVTVRTASEAYRSAAKLGVEKTERS